ncbi:MAG: DUF4249 domain-containing protein [Saprospiraceae bacterium]|nr:DUF4249 domain-containing protein [Saprospiraceae bacterium]
MKFRLYIGFLLILGCLACEEEFIPDGTNVNPQLVIEAYLEKSNEGFPFYLILTKTTAFYDKFSADRIQDLFIKADSAFIEVNSERILLDELCLNDLPPDLKKLALDRLGLNPDSVAIDICIYTDLSGTLQPSEGNIYQLKVYVKDEIVSAQTTIPSLVPLDSIWFEDVPGKKLDSFLQLFCKIKDTPNVSNYYRFFTAGQNENLIAGFTSVTDDYFFDGQEFKFTLQKATVPGSSFSDTTGYFKLGDTIRVKWCTIDKDHFDFWNTLEVSRTRQGPFSSYVRIKSNIVGGLGIFGGQHCKYYSVVVKK